MKAELWKIVTYVRGEWRMFGKKSYRGRKKARVAQEVVESKYTFAQFKVVKVDRNESVI